MKRLAFVALIFAVGCGGPKAGETCTKNSDCTPGDACKNGICVAQAGTGTSAGSTATASTSSGSSTTGAGAGSSGSSAGATGSTGSMVSSGSTGSGSTTSAGSSGSTGALGSTGSSGSSGSTCPSVVDCAVPACDGLACPGGVCSNGACVDGCLIDGGLVPGDGGNPGEACQVCDPSAPFTWTSRDDGLACDAGAVCSQGSCASGCFIDAGFYASGATEPGNGCAVCSPLSTTADWTPWNEGESAPCPQGAEVCHDGACAAGCYVAGGYLLPDAGNPANACERCQPAASTSAWTPLPDATVCSADGQHFCRGDTCISGCAIPGVGVVDAGAAKPGNVCLTCQPGSSTTDYTAANNGGSCSPDAGFICFAGACQYGCDINGSFQNARDTNGGNVCQVCTPSASTSSWTDPEGTACSASGGNYCHAGSCQYGCFIGGKFYVPGAANPANGCQVCTPATSTTTWSAKTCGSHQTCSSGQCRCDTNWADCDGSATNGCEADLTSEATCGSCTNACGACTCEGTGCGPKGMTCCTFCPICIQSSSGVYQCNF